MKYPVFILLCISMFACQETAKKNHFTGKEGEVRLITLAPGHFHAALLQKERLLQIDTTVHVYASEGTELDTHLSLISSYNQRTDNPTNWNEVVYRGEDYLTKMLEEKKGNVVILAGDNRLKIDYMQESVRGGINVLADKPMIIQPADFPKLEQVFETAAQNGVRLYDIMTERYDLIHRISKELLHSQELFGTLLSGSKEQPTIEMESMHHFFKEVSGKPLIRPAWFYDIARQGEGIVDVTTHLIDLVQWKCFPEEVIDYRKDIKVEDATHWTTPICLEEFRKSTGLTYFPSYMDKYLTDNILYVNANGTIDYKIKNIHVSMKVGWNFQAPQGAGDLHRTIIKGTKATLYILQGPEQGYASKLYIKNAENTDPESIRKNLEIALKSLKGLSGLSLKEAYEGMIEIIIPAEMKTGHEEHFTKVAQQYFDYLSAGEMPEWEIRAMLAKYYITTRSLEIARGKND